MTCKVDYTYITQLKLQFTWEHSHCKAVLGQKFSKSRQKRAKKWRFFENYTYIHNNVKNVKFCFLTPKRLILVQNHVV